MLIYQLEKMWADRQLAWHKPKKFNVASLVGPFPQRVIEEFVTEYFWGKTDIGGITRDFAKLYLCREFVRYYYVHHMGDAVSLVWAKANFKRFMLTRAAGAGWFAVGLFVGLIVLQVILWVLEWVESGYGVVTYPEGACILRYQDRLWWGALVGHPKKGVWDFYKWSEAEAMMWWEHHDEGKGYMKRDSWDFERCWEFVEIKMIGYFVYRVDEMWVRFLGKGTLVDIDTYRFRVPDGEKEPYEKPVGWGVLPVEACRYFGNWRSYWEERG